MAKHRFQAERNRTLNIPPSPSPIVLKIHESSPLDLASEEPERLPCLRRLLELGANINAADKHG